jgi:GTP cyclohydrolase I
LRRICRELLVTIGEDPDREGLKDTPRRWANWWRDFSEYQDGNTDTVFVTEQRIDQMVVVAGMRVWSLCEHHLLPFYCDVSVGYIAAEQVLGLSKFGRIAHKFAHRLQVQERLVDDIATEVQRLTGTEDVAVLAVGEHLCMTMRGIRTPSKMVSSAVYGRFRSQQEVRAEFMKLVDMASP